MNCVEEEYVYLALQHCECGGELKTDGQALRNENDRPEDVLSTCCLKCGKKSELCFDISAFYGDLSKYGMIIHPSKIIDALEWLTLSVLFIREAEPKDNDDKKMMLGQASFCLDQLLMFYPEGADLPRDESFFNQPDGKLPEERADLFRRERIAMLKKQTRDSSVKKEE